MSYLIGATAMLFFFIAISSSAYLGYKQGQKHRELEPIDKDKQRDIEKKQKSFEAIMSYDLNTAMGRKK